jgi:UPF0755 protein
MKRFVLALAVLAFLILGTGIFLPLNPRADREVVFAVKKGEGTRDIALHLEQGGLIPSAPLFRVFVASMGISGSLQAGTYLLETSLSPFEISRKLAAGDVITERITILEGWTIADIARYLEQKNLFSTEEVLAYGEFEGYLFPDTYNITKGELLLDIIERMLENFEAKVTQELRVGITQRGRTLSDVMIMASLLEKELQTIEDKKTAADILWKRLDIGMALQVDASPITYKERGLPEKPIANPGLQSIQAAVYPTESPYWYYLSTPEGKTIFSKTLQDHNRAKAEHLR